MLRLLRTGKWIGLTTLLVLAIAAFGALSFWQWERAQSDRSSAPPVAASQVFVGGQPLPITSYGTLVTATGRYDAAHQLLVARGSGFWVVTPLVRDDGAALPVARGTVSGPDDPAVADVTTGQVVVVGRAEPFDGDPGTPSTLPAGQSDRLTAAALALPYDATGGYLALTEQQPVAATAPTPVVPPFSPDAGAPLRLQNVSYAIQWLIFAGFAVLVWFRALRDDLADEREQAPPAPPEPVREVY